MQALALDVHSLLRDLDPARAHLDRAEERLEVIKRKIEALPVTAAEEWARLAALAEEHRPRTDEQWEAFRLAAQPVYEGLACHLQTLDIHVPSLRPSNYTRNLFHVFGAALAIGLMETVLPLAWLLPVASCVAGLAWTLETLRRLFPAVNRFCLWVFQRVRHPHESHRVNSSTWYATALVALAATGRLELAVMAIAVLGLADPAAAVIGRRFGKHRLIHGRSLEGTITFVIVGFVAAFSVGLLHLAPPAAAVGALGASLLGALAELTSRRIDDNLSIPLASAAGAWALLQLL